MIKKLFLLITLLASVSYAATVSYYVDPSGTDDGSHGTGTGTDAWATIEYAINAVSNPTVDVISIHIAAGTYTTNSNMIDIDREFADLTLQGASASTTIVQAETTEGSATDRVFYITGTGEHVTISALTIRHGKTSDKGGAIYNNGGDLSIENCSISDNAADRAAGIFSLSGTLVITNTTISGNNATTDAGAMFVTGGFTLTNSTVFDNAAPHVGGILGQDGLYEYTVTNCTISNNTSSGSSWAGGFALGQGDNTVYMKNTILANNTSTSGGHDFQIYSGTLVDNYYNIVEYYTGTGITFDASNNIIGNQTNLNLSSTLADNNTTNGTQTLKTTSGSVAINAGSSASANNGVAIPTTDQRGASRNGTIDIGAYEYFADDGSLPVELSSFTAQSKRGIVSLSWTTSSEIENLGFTIERTLRQAQGSNIEPVEMWTTISSYKTNPELAGQGSTTNETSYSFTDKDVRVGEKYEYRLSDVDYQGKLTQHKVITVLVRDNGSDVKPGTFKMLTAYPNPFNPCTTLSYTLEQDMQVTISVVDLRGRTVRTITNSHQLAADYSFEWNGTNNQGLQMNSGIYFFNIQGANFYQAVKIVKLD